MPTAKPRQPYLTRFACLAVLLSIAAGCGDATSPPPEGGGNPMPPDTTSMNALTDADIRALAEPDSTWTWWEFSDSLLDRAGNSPHVDRIRVRYNASAATQLDSAGRVVVGADFPDSSAVVKEVFSGGVAIGFLVMYKAEGDPHAGHGSWLWAEFGANDQVVHSVAADDGPCHNCHVAGEDHMRMNDTH
jgi:hypothetical protein